MRIPAQIRHGVLAALILFGAVACVDVPELGERVSPALDRADYPTLVPIERLLEPATPVREEAETLANQLDARRARLQRRADALQGTIVDPETRARMSDGVAQ